MRISAKVDYAIRAMTEMAVADAPITAEKMATAQDLPLRYLLGILGDLRRNRLVQSQRGPEGGFTLAQPASQISLADVFRAIDGPLAEIHDLSLTNLEYQGPATELRTVWLAVRASLRRVLETVSLADVAAGQLPEHVLELAEEYESAVADRRPAGR
jgi:Rrf2 family protein